MQSNNKRRKVDLDGTFPDSVVESPEYITTKQDAPQDPPPNDDYPQRLMAMISVADLSTFEPDEELRWFAVLMSNRKTLKVCEGGHAVYLPDLLDFLVAHGFSHVSSRSLIPDTFDIYPIGKGKVAPTQDMAYQPSYFHTIAGIS
ncbi:hypothetical protein NX059_009365 [Plenodomus lindquistii]|nr:hypothetical protein NX059_009365 [Plenodomus lindquistii]